MDPTLRLGPLVVSSYTALIDLGLVLGAALVLLRARRRERDLRRTVDAMLSTALGGLIAARAGYVALHWSYYSEHWRQALRLRDGGLVGPSATIGGLIAATLYCLLKGSSLPKLLDVLTPGAALLAAFAWLGCLMIGCAYGLETYPTDPLWALSLDLPDLYGIRAPRVAVQLLGAAWSGLALIAVLIAERQWRPEGLLFPLWLTLYSVGAFGLGFLRADEVSRVAGWRVDQLANLALTAGGLGWLMATRIQKRVKEANR